MTRFGRLSLSEFSNKYDVSVSTLRRRIRTGLVDCILENGKYLLLDASLTDQKKRLNQTQATSDPMSLAPPQLKQGHRSVTSIPSVEMGELSDQTFIEVQEPISPEPIPEEGSVFSTAQEILGELKKAYVQILQEKEEQIVILKEEIVDLHTLVRVLEEDNVRLKKEKEQKPIGDWLDSIGHQDK